MLALWYRGTIFNLTFQKSKTFGKFKIKNKMFIEEIITRTGVWEANPEASFHYREETFGFGIREEEADKIVAKTTGARFAFRGNSFGK